MKKTLSLALSCAGICCHSIALAHGQFADGHSHDYPVAAGLITRDNARHWMVEGDKSWGGVDDWFLSNGTLCAVISGEKHESDATTTGGFLVDLGYCGERGEHFLEAFPLFNFDSNLTVTVTDIRAESTADSAAIITEGDRAGTRVRTEYRVNAQQPTRLDVRLVVTKTEDDPQVSSLTFATISIGTLRQFDVSFNPQVAGRGFERSSGWRRRGG